MNKSLNLLRTKIKRLYSRIKKTLVSSFYHFVYPHYTNKNINSLKAHFSSTGKISVLFLLQQPEVWNSQKSVYRLLTEDDRFSVSVLAIPRFEATRKRTRSFTDFSSLKFCRKEGIECNNALKGPKYVHVSKFKPDFIFIQKPYEDKLPRCYSFFNLFKAGLICYIPYFAKMTDDFSHYTAEFNKKFMNSFFYYFADTSNRFNYVQNWIDEHNLSLLKKPVYTGFPRFDLISNNICTTDHKSGPTTVLYTPRGTAATVDLKRDMPGHFIEYIHPLLEFFENNQDYKLIIRPHPNMIPNYLYSGIITKSELNELEERISHSNNISFDSNEDYLVSFSEADILLADFTSLILEFFYTAKPILFCDNLWDATGDYLRIANTFYYCSSPTEAINTIRELSHDDSKKEMRTKLLAELRPNNQNAAQAIRDELVSFASAD